MGPAETLWREEAERLRQEAAKAASCAARCDFAADLLAIEGLDLSDPFCPSAGDALALRGEA